MGKLLNSSDIAHNNFNYHVTSLLRTIIHTFDHRWPLRLNMMTQTQNSLSDRPPLTIVVIIKLHACNSSNELNHTQ